MAPSVEAEEPVEDEVTCPFPNIIHPYVVLTLSVKKKRHNKQRIIQSV